MNTKSLLILTVFLAGISIGAAIKCYVCTGSETSDCAKGKPSAMSVVNCKNPGYDQAVKTHYYYHPRLSDEQTDDLNPPQLKSVCLKLTETDYQPKLYARGCGLFPVNSDPCNYLQENFQITGCKSCKTDLCNQRAELHQNAPDFNIID